MIAAAEKRCRRIARRTLGRRAALMADFGDTCIDVDVPAVVRSRTRSDEMSNHKPRKPSGRVAFDDRGNATWEWRGELGSHDHDLDTQRLKALEADLSIDSDHASRAGMVHDPYNRSQQPNEAPSGPKKRTMDDLRRLSHQIKTSRYWKNDK